MYLRGTMEYGLRYLGDDEVKLRGYIDPNWVGSATGRESTLGCFFNMGLAMISWFNRMQASMVLSAIKVEYMVVSIASCEAIRLCILLAGLFDEELDPTVIYCDN
jgi:hypothetical protein